ncbi:MAG: hypothetical protein ABIR19_05715 [Ginsengibacter sp.]
MSGCNFTIPFAGVATEVLSKAKAAIESQNGYFMGDTQSGNFEVSVLSNNLKGSYSISGSAMNILIEDKPFFVPCSTIESFLKNKLS